MELQTRLQTARNVLRKFRHKSLFLLARSERFELPTLGIEIRSFSFQSKSLGANRGGFGVLISLTYMTRCKPPTFQNGSPFELPRRSLPLRRSTRRRQ